MLWLLLALFAVTPQSRATNSAQDADVMVDPVIRYFPVTTFGTESAAAQFTVNNKNTTQAKVLGAISLDGAGADQFDLAADTCSGVTLAAGGGSCTFSVKFKPTGRGDKWANVLIPSNDAETPILTAFVSNCEVPATEAQRRMPPVLVALTVPDTMVAGHTYTLTWSLQGYNTSYSSNLVMFDCTDVTSDCGANYGDSTRFVDSGSLNPVSVTTGDWDIDGISDQQFNYTWNFTVPATRSDGSGWSTAGTEIVVRFYNKDDIDQERGRGKVSLLIPGNLAGEYYDTAGRRIVKRIAP
jgi:hypothetical protein